MNIINKLPLYVLALTLTFTLLFSSISFAVEYLPLSESFFHNEHMTFMPHQGEGPFDTTLAMNVQNAPVKAIRDNLSEILNYDLQFFKLWNPNGEAHITVITPPEYFTVIKQFVSIERIEQIALRMHIQYSDLTILGIGRGEAQINNKAEETYFIIAQSQNLLRIRQEIYKEYLQNGSPAKAWNPNHYYPHITIGFSLRDLHEVDSVIKDMAHSYDSRFALFLRR